MKTGYFARASEKEHKAHCTKVHIVSRRKALCGYIPHKTMEFQVCAWEVHLPYVKCKRCIKKYVKLIEEFAERVSKRYDK